MVSGSEKGNNWWRRINLMIRNIITTDTWESLQTSKKVCDIIQETDPQAQAGNGPDRCLGTSGAQRGMKDFQVSDDE